MRIIHTSDWHLGRNLYDRKRYHEFTAFLDWLAATIETGAIDALLVSGDVFDTTTPSNRAQEIYYRFLCRVAQSGCPNVIITGGNHDSPSFLEAPKELLRVMNIQVIGAMPPDPGEEVILLKNRQGKPAAIVCAVPYLRDRDIRLSSPGESLEDKSAKLIAGIKEHYALVAAIAENQRVKLEELPIIGMGHLFTAGATPGEDDGTRDLYVGSLAHIRSEELPDCFDYLALGHLHRAQTVAASETRRYCGSPLPMSFSEAGQTKKVIQVEFFGKTPTISELPVPCFQPLARISGDRNEIAAGIAALKEQDSNAWLEIEYTGKEVISDLSGLVEEMLADSKLDAVKIKDRRLIDLVIEQTRTGETLEELNLEEVFSRCLAAAGISEDQHPELQATYSEIIKAINEEDKNAE